jgi:hypothetical protein
MSEYMSFWFAKTLTEFLTGIGIIAGAVLLLFFWFIIYSSIVIPYKTAKEMKYWKSQTPQWRRNKYNSMNDNFSPENWPKKWQTEMVEQDRKNNG